MEVIYIRQEEKDPVVGVYGVRSKQVTSINTPVNSSDTLIFAFSNNTTSITTNKVYLSNSDTADHTVSVGIKDQVTGAINYIITVTVSASTTNQEFTMIEGIDISGDLYMKADADGFITATVFATERYVSE